MPRIVLDEFARNRDRVVEQSRRSFSSHIKHVREAVAEFGEEKGRAAMLRELSDGRPHGGTTDRGTPALPTPSA